MPFFASMLLKMSGLTPLLKKYWKELIVAGMVAMLLYQNFSSTRFLMWIETIPSLEARLEVSEYNYQTTKDGNDRLSAAIEKRNAEIDEWKAVSDKNAAKVAELEGDLAVARSKTNTKVKDVLNDPTPKTSKDAIQYLRTGIGDVQW